MEKIIHTLNCYKIGLAALQFFGFAASEQVKSWTKRQVPSAPIFFANKREQDCGCDYFFGVACVFKTYGGTLYDKFASAEEADCLEDFNHRLNVFMQYGTTPEWSEVGISKGETWKRLRMDAKRALDQLGEPLPSEVPSFDIEALIDPDEFLSNQEALGKSGSDSD